MKKRLSKPFLFLFRKLREERGDVDMLLILFVTFLGVSIIMTMLEPFITREKMLILSNRMVEEVEYNGIVDTATHSKMNTLINTLSLNKNNINYKFEGNIRSGGKIQLRDEFHLTIKGEHKLKIANFSDWINITIPISHKATGQSQVYYRPSEL